MASSSKSRSRSNRRSPNRRKSPKKGKEAEVPEASKPAGADVQVERATQSRARTSGAVQNRRKKGDPGTWTCSECRRTIADNDCAKKQHWDSLHCRVSRLYNRGYHNGDWEACKKQVEREMKTETWEDESNVRLRSKERSRGAEPPPEPKNPPRAPGADARRETRMVPEKRERSRSRERARGSGRDDGTSGRHRTRSRSTWRAGGGESQEKGCESSNEPTGVKQEVGKEDAGAKPSGKKVVAGNQPGCPPGKPAPKAGAATGRPAASDEVPAAGNEFRSLMMDLLKTAMETAGKRYQ
eukprot:s1320_g12.t1